MRIRLFMGLAILCLFGGNVDLRAQNNGDVYRWDIVTINSVGSDVIGGSGTQTVITANGTALTAAADASTMTITGSGSFVVDQSPRLEGLRIGPSAAGGGTWVLRDSPAGTFAGGIIGGGTYKVTGFVAFTLAPGTLSGTVVDNVGRGADIRAGLAVLRVQYSDGALGLITVSCRLAGTPESVLQGVRLSKGFVDFSGQTSTVFHFAGGVR